MNRKNQFPLPTHSVIKCCVFLFYHALWCANSTIKFNGKILNISTKIICFSSARHEFESDFSLPEKKKKKICMTKMYILTNCYRIQMTINTICKSIFTLHALSNRASQLIGKNVTHVVLLRERERIYDKLHPIVAPTSPSIFHQFWEGR